MFVILQKWPPGQNKLSIPGLRCDHDFFKTETVKQPYKTV